MTTTADAPVDLDCRCGDGRWSHKRGSGGCRVMDCPCDKYEPPKVRPKSAPAPADDWPLPAVEIEDAEQAGLVVRPESPGADPVAAVEAFAHPTLAEVEAEPEPADDPEPEPAPVVADPAAQAEHAEQVAAIDAQLAESRDDRAERLSQHPDRSIDDKFARVVAERDDLAGALADTERERDKAEADRARLSEQLMARLRDLDKAQTRIAQLEHHARILTAERNGERTANAALYRELAELESFAARERGARSAEIAQLHAELDRANATRQRLQDQLDQAVHTGLNAASQVIGRYTAHACLTCGARYGKPYTDHEHGPLTPVVVTIARADRPGPAPTEEN